MASRGPTSENSDMENANKPAILFTPVLFRHVLLTPPLLLILSLGPRPSCSFHSFHTHSFPSRQRLLLLRLRRRLLLYYYYCYYVKTRERRGSSFSQLGLEPNHTGLTAQSLFFLEESCRVKRSDTQTSLKLLKLLQKSSQASKTFFQLLQIKRLQLKLTNNLQNSYQISSQHQVPKTWVKQHPKTPKTTKTNENPSPSSSMHKLVPFGSKLVPTWFLPGSYRFLWVL